MKNNTFKFLVVISIVVLGMNNVVFAQWQYNGSKIYYNNGNVGIGDNNPVQELTVDGKMIVYGSQATVLFGDDNNTSVGWGEYGIEYWNGGLNFWKPFGNTYHPGYAKNGILFLADNGSVGINTLNPNSNYKLTVNGGILAEEVKIISSVGADFVFSKNYKLPELSQIDKYIKENKHLPDIPSAEEMKTNGLDMGEFQIKLLQKIEELTLYVIELEKKNKEIENRLNNL